MQPDVGPRQVKLKINSPENASTFPSLTNVRAQSPSSLSELSSDDSSIDMDIPMPSPSRGFRATHRPTVVRIPTHGYFARAQHERREAEVRRREERKAAEEEADRRHNAFPSLFGERVENSIAERDEYMFELWVEIEGEKVPVHGTTREVFDCSQGWIQSEIGKVSLPPLECCRLHMLTGVQHYTVNARIKRKITVSFRLLSVDIAENGTAASFAGKIQERPISGYANHMSNRRRLGWKFHNGD